MKILRNIVLIGAVAMLSSCAVSGPAISPQALVTENPMGQKEGIAETRIWLGIWIGNHDLSITKAAKNGNITKVATVDREIQGGFLNTTYRTIVTGE